MTTISAPTTGTSTSAAPLAGRVAVVTGASSGIGEATARGVVARGGRVALLARRADRLDAIAVEMDAGDRVLTRALDVTDAPALDAWAAELGATLGRPDLVVANAGVMLPGPAATQPFEEWRRQVDVNLLGVLATIRAFVPGLLAAAAEGRPADLVLISSIGAHQVFPQYAVYGATKAAVTMLGADLRAELGAQGVRVTVVEPGFTATELQHNVTDDQHRDQLRGWLGALETLTADDVADVITHVAALPARVNLARVVVMPTAQP